MSDTYLRVCVLRDGHDGDHLDYGDAPDKDEFGNKHVEWPRCVHVSPVPEGEAERYRVVFEMVDPRMPRAGWHEVVNEHSRLRDAREQFEGLLMLEEEHEVRNPRLERAVVRWEPVDLADPERSVQP